MGRLVPRMIVEWGKAEIRPFLQASFRLCSDRYDYVRNLFGASFLTGLPADIPAVAPGFFFPWTV